jgi:pimeloyl-ACP methyl ester carboxylesterase
MSSIIHENISISYTDHGQGPPLVLIHGHPFNRSMWAGQINDLRATHRIIAPDLRGYGETSVTPGKVTLADHAHDILRLIDTLELEQIVLGGLSMGGQIVLEFYWRYPERVRGLLLAASFAQQDTPEVRERRLATAERLLREGMQPYAHEVLPMMLASSTIEEQPTVAAQVLEMMCTTQPEGAAAALRGRAERRDYTPLLPQIHVPTLIMLGSEDAFTPLDEAQAQHRAIPNAELHILNGAGHMPNLERPTDFNAILQRWLASLG